MFEKVLTSTNECSIMILLGSTYPSWIRNKFPTPSHNYRTASVFIHWLFCMWAGF